jgi:molecular chaperone DnaK
MVKDAEANAADDRRQLELVTARNQADSLVHTVRKSLAEHGGSLDASEKEKIEAALREVEEAIKGNDREAIEQKTQALATASQKLGEKMYAQEQAAAGAAAGAAGGAGAAGSGRADGDVVDAEFEEVKDAKK